MAFIDIIKQRNAERRAEQMRVVALRDFLDYEGDEKIAVVPLNVAESDDARRAVDAYKAEVLRGYTAEAARIVEALGVFANREILERILRACRKVDDLDARAFDDIGHVGALYEEEAIALGRIVEEVCGRRPVGLTTEELDDLIVQIGTAPSEPGAIDVVLSTFHRAVLQDALIRACKRLSDEYGLVSPEARS